LPSECIKFTTNCIYQSGIPGGGRVFEVQSNMKQGTSWKFLVGNLRHVISMEDIQDLEPRKH